MQSLLASLADSCTSARDTDASRMKGPIEALLFDFGGTLDASGVAWKERFYAFYRDEGLDMAAEADRKAGGNHFEDAT